MTGWKFEKSCFALKYRSSTSILFRNRPPKQSNSFPLAVVLCALYGAHMHASFSVFSQILCLWSRWNKSAVFFPEALSHRTCRCVEYIIIACEHLFLGWSLASHSRLQGWKVSCRTVIRSIILFLLFYILSDYIVIFFNINLKLIILGKGRSVRLKNTRIHVSGEFCGDGWWNCSALLPYARFSIMAQPHNAPRSGHNFSLAIQIFLHRLM